MKNIFFLAVTFGLTMLVLPMKVYSQQKIGQEVLCYPNETQGNYQVSQKGNKYIVALNQGGFSVIESEVENQEQLSSSIQLISKACKEYLIRFKDNERNSHFEARVYFEFDQTKLTTASKEVLEEVVNQHQPGTILTITGHTDSIGSEGYNQQLGLQRARTVSNYLISKGVDLDDLHIESFGESTPLEPNATLAGRSMNRRVLISM